MRGEWIAPWGVAEVQRLGLYDLLMGAGGHHLTRHVTYDETRRPRGRPKPAPCRSSIFAPGVPGPLCLRHPLHCQTLFDAAAKAGAMALRGVNVLETHRRRAAARGSTSLTARRIEARGGC